MQAPQNVGQALDGVKHSDVKMRNISDTDTFPFTVNKEETMTQISLLIFA